MATAELTGAPRAPLRERETVAGKLLRVAFRAPVQAFLTVIGLLWLVPTIGLFLTSILPAQAFTVKGWWQIFSKPSLITWSNYSHVLHNSSIMHSLVTTVEIAVGNTVLVVLIGALAGYALAWLEFPGRDWLLLVVIAEELEDRE